MSHLRGRGRRRLLRPSTTRGRGDPERGVPLDRGDRPPWGGYLADRCRDAVGSSMFAGHGMSRARGGIRTPTPLRAPAPKAGASAGFRHSRARPRVDLHGRPSPVRDIMLPMPRRLLLLALTAVLASCWTGTRALEDITLGETLPSRRSGPRPPADIEASRLLARGGTLVALARTPVLAVHAAPGTERPFTSLDAANPWGQ